jgi:hypothetical protein
VTWSRDGGPSGTEVLAPGARLVVARRMTLPEQQPFTVERIDGSVYLFVRLPYVSDPALVLSATDGHPVLHRGQRANGAVVELTAPGGAPTTPEPGQRVSLTASGTRVELRVPALVLALEVELDQDAAPTGSGTVQLGVAALEHDDAWLVAALAVALSPEHGVVGHADLKAAFAAWRDEPEMSDGTFDRNVLRPSLEARGVELPGRRLNKIVYLVERCRRTAEFPPRVLDEVRARLDV